MRLLTGTAIVSFYNDRDDILVLTQHNEFVAIDQNDIIGRHDAYTVTTTRDNTEVTVLLERSTITGGDYFPDALDEDGALRPEVAEEMATIINADAGLHRLVALAAAEAAHTAYLEAETAYKEATTKRQVAFAEALDLMGRGGQAVLARRLELSAPTVKSIADRGRGIQNRESGTVAYDWTLRYLGTDAETGTVWARDDDHAVELALPAAKVRQVDNHDVADSEELWDLVVRRRGHNTGADSWIQYEATALNVVLDRG